MGSGQRGSTFAQRLQRAWLTRGPLATSLLPLAALFGVISRLRRVAYRFGVMESKTLPVPVVVVGNLIAGGAGKTPTVIAVVDLLRRNGFTPGILSRGYGRVSRSSTQADSVVAADATTRVSEAGDEPLLLRLRTGAPVFVGRDRFAAGCELLRRHPEVNIIVSDDGLQHLRLSRTAQVLVFDERGAGNGWLLPAGPLREPLPASPPARSLVLYNATRPSTPLPGSLVHRSLAGVVELAQWHAGRNAVAGSLDSLRGRPLMAAAGLAHPERFFAMLRDHGLAITPLPLPDHFDYATLPWPATAEDVIVTEKDAIKLRPDAVGRTRVWVAALDFAPAADFDIALLALLPAAPESAGVNHIGPDHGNTTS